MKFSTNHAPAQTHNVNTVKSQIAQTGAMFDLLSTRLYSRPLEAAIRETLKNALDAHIDANQTKPVDITLPSDTDSHLIIRDYGYGLTHEQILDNFINYGNTSKDDDERQHGGMGIGSKAPFSITDQFSVVTTQNHQQSSYIFFRQPGQGPEIADASVLPTTQPDGLEIVIPIKRTDRDRARFTLLDLLKSFPVGFAAVDGVLHVSSTPIYKTLDGFLDNHHEVKVQCGPVIYDYEFNDDLYQGLKNITITVNASEVTIAPSRESLINDERTDATVNRTLNNFLDDLPERYLPTVIGQIPDAPRKRVLYAPSTYRTGTQTIKYSNRYLTWFRASLTCIPKSQIIGTFQVKDVLNCIYPKMKLNIDEDIYLTEDTYVVYDDILRAPKYRERLAQDRDNFAHLWQVVVVSKTDSLPRYCTLSDITLPKVIRDKADRRKMSNFKVWKQRERSTLWSDKAWYKAPANYFVSPKAILVPDTTPTTLNLLNQWQIDYNRVVVCAKNPEKMDTLAEWIERETRHLLANDTRVQDISWLNAVETLDWDQKGINHLLRLVNHPAAIPASEVHHFHNNIKSDPCIPTYDLTLFHKTVDDNPLLKLLATDPTHPDVINKILGA